MVEVGVEPVAGDGPDDPVQYAVALHVLMSQAEIELWESWADQRRLEVDDVAHAAALLGLKDQLTQAGDKMRTHVAAVRERQLLARLGLEAGNGAPRPRWGIEPR
jgi:hypothetical protein